MRYRWKDDPWWSEAPGRPFRLAALGLAVGLPALLFAALVRNAVVSPPTTVNPLDRVVKKMRTDPDREARREAIRELWQGGHKDTVVGELTSGQTEARGDVSDFLVELGPESIAELLPLLYDQRRRPTAIGVLLRMGPTAADRLIAEMQQHQGELTTTLIGVLGEMGPSAAGQSVPAIRQVLRSGDATARTTAADVLGSLGPAAHAAIPDLIAALNDADAGVRIQSMQTLGRFGPVAASAAPAIARSLCDPQVASAVADALGKLGAVAVEPLAAALDDPSQVVRLASTQALGAIGPPASKVADKLSRMAELDVDVKVRRAAAIALAAVKREVANNPE